MNTADEEVLEALVQQDELRPFFEEGFDEEKYVTSIVSVKLVAQELTKLQEGIATIQGELNAQVANRHTDLITQATGIQKLEDVLVMITSRVGSLHKSIAKIKDKLMTPYSAIQDQMQKLIQMQTACELLRRTNKFLALCAKLRNYLAAGEKDMNKAAYALFELAYFLNDTQLQGIHVIEKQRAWIFETRDVIEKTAREKLAQGLDRLKHQTIAASLQVFGNLGTLKQEVSSVMSKRLKMLEKALKATLQPPASMTDNVEIRAHVWENVELVLKHFRKVLFESRTLHLVMKRKKAQASYLSFAEIVEPSPGGLAHTTCVDMMRLFQKEFASAEANAKARRVLENNFPKFLQMVMEKWRQMAHHFTADHNASLTLNEVELLRQSLAPFETGYIRASFLRLIDFINRIFSGPSADSNSAASAVHTPSNDDIHKLVQCMSGEMLGVHSDSSLLVAISHNVYKACELFCKKTRKRVAQDESALNVAKKASVAMRTNIAIVNALFYFNAELDQLVEAVHLTLRVKIPQDASTALRRAKELGEELMKSVFDPLFSSSRSYLLTSVSVVHDKPLSVASSSGDVVNRQCTQYMDDLRQDILHIHEQVLSRFSCPSLLQPPTERLLREMMEFYVINLCTFDSLSQDMKLILTADLAQFEVALEPLVHSAGKQPQELGAQYRMLRGLRTLFFTEPQDISSQMTNATVSLPPSYVLHYLFSQTGGAIPTPRQCDGADHFQYGLWLLDATEEERVQACKLALAKYGKSAKNGGGDRHALYPMLVSMTML